MSARNQQTELIASAVRATTVRLTTTFLALLAVHQCIACTQCTTYDNNTTTSVGSRGMGKREHLPPEKKQKSVIMLRFLQRNYLTDTWKPPQSANKVKWLSQGVWPEFYQANIISRGKHERVNICKYV